LKFEVQPVSPVEVWKFSWSLQLNLKVQLEVLVELGMNLNFLCAAIIFISNPKIHIFK
jgi:hypothetical protein